MFDSNWLEGIDLIFSTALAVVLPKSSALVK